MNKWYLDQNLWDDWLLLYLMCQKESRRILGKDHEELESLYEKFIGLRKGEPVPVEKLKEEDILSIFGF